MDIHCSVLIALPWWERKEECAHFSHWLHHWWILTFVLQLNGYLHGFIYNSLHNHSHWMSPVMKYKPRSPLYSSWLSPSEVTREGETKTDRHQQENGNAWQWLKAQAGAEATIWPRGRGRADDLYRSWLLRWGAAGVALLQHTCHHSHTNVMANQLLRA